MKSFAFPLSLLLWFRILYWLLFYSLLKIIALLTIHCNVLSFRIGIFNQANTLGRQKHSMHTDHVHWGVWSIIPSTPCSVIGTMTLEMRWSLKSLTPVRGTWGHNLRQLLEREGVVMPEVTRAPCNSEHRAVPAALLPLLGYLVVDLMLWGKEAKHLVFPAREYGRQHVNRVLSILPLGGPTLCYHLSLRVDSTDKY